MCQSCFTRATRAYAANPSTVTLMLLNRSAVSLLAPDAPPIPFDRKWTDIHAAGALANDFQSIRITIDRRLSDYEVEQAAGAVGYALREVLCGEELGAPHILRSYSAQQTILICAYDSSEFIRSAPDFAFAFEKAGVYVVEGSPLRITNRAGAGTMGTRLVQGIGRCKVDFAVR